MWKNSTEKLVIRMFFFLLKTPQAWKRVIEKQARWDPLKTYSLVSHSNNLLLDFFCHLTAKSESSFMVFRGQAFLILFASVLELFIFQVCIVFYTFSFLSYLAIYTYLETAWIKSRFSFELLTFLLGCWSIISTFTILEVVTKLLIFIFVFLAKQLYFLHSFVR